METEIVSFQAKDGILLDGILVKNDEAKNKILIQIHGMTSNCFKNRDKTIATEVCKIPVDVLRFNNRGSEIIRYIDNGKQKRLGGMAYEDVEESYFDIVGAIEYALQLGYQTIYLQGHSLGCTKVVYTYHKMIQENNELISKIKGIILLSMVDIPGMVSSGITPEMVHFAEEKEKKRELMDLMPSGSFIHPISVKSYLKYIKYYENFDFAQFGNENCVFQELNEIQCPLMMRWGNINELIKQDARELSDFMNQKITQDHKNISYIDGADHGYHGKETILAKEIQLFLQTIE